MESRIRQEEKGRQRSDADLRVSSTGFIHHTIESFYPREGGQPLIHQGGDCPSLLGEGGQVTSEQGSCCPTEAPHLCALGCQTQPVGRAANSKACRSFQMWPTLDKVKSKVKLDLLNFPPRLPAHPFPVIGFCGSPSGLSLLGPLFHAFMSTDSISLDAKEPIT